MQDYITVFFRIITIMSLLLFVTIYIMGKRPIGELPVFDFLTIITMGSIVGADIADPSIHHMPTAFAVVMLAIFQYVVSRMILKHRKFGRLVTFEPTLIMENGQFLTQNMKSVKYSIDELLMMLREKDVFYFNEVQYAIIESNGKLTVLKKAEVSPVVAKDLNVSVEEKSIADVVILEGNIEQKNMEKLQITEDVIMNLVKDQGYQDIKHIFIATYNTQQGLSISPYHVDTRQKSIKH
ncbi:protein of unknown function DUF421 [Alkaliphilus metalliredigens QYMF]|uniref:YetF C-terminal domain-containing protein n=1 Tax=Alkaliphilus metalliredigens (strain QYMF) TaxID=293826 RepID=A6TWY6_ALKMQ|nr:DUF421 domain-containing protein [Alkaliphilus metalliredigens]ABR50704.1 protein of unknown function DUF421 [Alkaliphilus metalliredigens QYMF]